MKVRDVVIWLRHPVNGDPKVELVAAKNETVYLGQGLSVRTLKDEIIFVPYDNIVSLELGPEREQA
jgi:hypothetical protein